MYRNDFSVDDFKKWIEKDHKVTPKDEAIGGLVESVVSNKRLAAKMVVEDGDQEELIEDFRKNGGKIIDVQAKGFLIEVNAGSFFIPKFYVATKS